ncbi:hypothetical protein AWC38_SpisGene22102 [Stylophora pistillata]|uniref:Uncharacterized protein n=1 Tax=Stylophora pistillata TaxID=50429 RepID=A0A2B4RAF4_STYPI|nr:hypothetical protein AWC38_SpisGene22102 [Stylophora pistillata]
MERFHEERYLAQYSMSLTIKPDVVGKITTQQVACLRPVRNERVGAFKLHSFTVNMWGELSCSGASDLCKLLIASRVSCVNLNIHGRVTDSVATCLAENFDKVNSCPLSDLSINIRGELTRDGNSILQSLKCSQTFAFTLNVQDVNVVDKRCDEVKLYGVDSSSLKEAFTKFESICSRVSKLSLNLDNPSNSSEVDWGCSAGDVLAKFVSLATLSLSFNQYDGWKKGSLGGLWSGVAQNTSITTLSITVNNYNREFTGWWIRGLWDSLNRNTSITTLIITFNIYSEVNWDWDNELCGCLKENTSVTALSITENFYWDVYADNYFPGWWRNMSLVGAIPVFSCKCANYVNRSKREMGIALFPFSVLVCSNHGGTPGKGFSTGVVAAGSQDFASPSEDSTSHKGQQNRRLKVTLLSSEWRSSTDREVSTIVRALAVQLAKYPNVEVSVFLPECSEEDRRNATSLKIQLIEADKLSGFEPILWLLSLPRNHDVDCAIGHGVHLGRQIQLIKRNKDCRWIQVVHSVHEEEGMYKDIFEGERLQQTEVELCQMADEVVAIGPKVAEAYTRYLSFAKEEETILDLTPGVFSEFFNVVQATDERKTFCVLVIGSGDSCKDFNVKGFNMAAEAIPELKDPSYKLKFLYSPKEKGEEIAEKLLQHGISRNQLIVRNLDDNREALANLFREVDLAIMPSRTEGFGLPGLEALSAGLPVLVSGNSGLMEKL